MLVYKLSGYKLCLITSYAWLQAVPDYKLPPSCKWDRLFSVMKCSVWWCKLRTFWDNMSRRCHRLPEASVTSNRCCVTNQKSEDLVNRLSWQCRLVVLCGLSSRMLGRAERRWGVPHLECAAVCNTAVYECENCLPSSGKIKNRIKWWDEGKSNWSGDSRSYKTEGFWNL